MFAHSPTCDAAFVYLANKHNESTSESTMGINMNLREANKATKLKNTVLILFADERDAANGRNSYLIAFHIDIIATTAELVPIQFHHDKSGTEQIKPKQNWA